MTARGRYRTRIRRLQENLRMRRPIVVLCVGVLLPVVLSSSVGIVALALWETPKDIVLGVLAVSLAAAAVGGGIVVTILLGRRARLARIQSDLLGNVSHELKTPLAAIRMYAQTLQSGVVAGDPGLARDCADAIARETEWLGSMIERLLTWRAAARDRAHLELEAGPLSDAVRAVAERFSRMLPRGETDFRVEVETRQAVLHDRGAIESVLLNLLTNAYKYTGEKKRISLSVTDEADSVVLRVTDNGIGIPEREWKRIFEPFYRVELQGGGVAPGSGLGLAIVAVTVRAMSGTVSVESKEGEGSTFTVTLPAAERSQTGS